nr:phosphoribosylglycinamide formyltransferase [uncultured Flavobacterium sp.]
MKRILFFASGNGTNVENVMRHFKGRNDIEFAGVFCNNPEAKVLDKVKPQNLFTYVFDKSALNDGLVLKKINQLQPDLIVLAGFLWKMPDAIVHQYPNKIINIHPALLPKYGGKGMYGMHVHQAVLNNKEKETGITIHYVNEHYDEGEFIFQASVNIEDCQTPEEIATKVHELEHEHFPKVIEKLLIPNP